MANPRFLLVLFLSLTLSNCFCICCFFLRWNIDGEFESSLQLEKRSASELRYLSPGVAFAVEEACGNIIMHITLQFKVI